MKLLPALASSVKKFSESKCCTLVQFDNGNDNTSSELTTVKNLSYEAAWEVVKCHEAWLSHVVQTFVAIPPASRDNHDPTNKKGNDVVVAYLSSNSIDMFLSMLACTSVRSVQQQKFGGTRATPVLVALLNTRWTPQEMANALRSKSSITARSIVLYGLGFDKVAQQVISKLSHQACCHPMPYFSENFFNLQSSSAVGTIITPTNSSNPNIILSNSHYDSSHKPRKNKSKPQQTQLERTTTTRTESTNNNNATISTTDSGHDDHDQLDAMIVFTSGTTGGSKGVRLSHRAIWIQALAKLGSPCEYSPETVMSASTVPLFHVGGLSSCFAVLLAGGNLVFPSAARELSSSAIKTTTRKSSTASFDVDTLRKSLLPQRMQQQEKQSFTSYSPVNTLVVVPAMLVAFFDNEDKRYSSRTTVAANTASTTTSSMSLSYPGIRLILIGGQSASSRVVDRITKSFPNARIVQTYACTEAASSLTFLHVKTQSSNNNDRTNNHYDSYASATSSKEILTTTTIATTKQAKSGTITMASNVVGDCVGVPPLHVEVRLFPMPEDDGNDNNKRAVTTDQLSSDNTHISDPFKPGIIATRGPHVMNGYWQRGGHHNNKDHHQRQLSINTRTDEVNHYDTRDLIQQQLHKHQHNSSSSSRRIANGISSSVLSPPSSSLSSFLFFRTNDIGFFDTYGQLYFCGRVKDVIRTGGETVWAQEVERVINLHPNIKECAVFAKPDERFGEAVACAVVANVQGNTTTVTTNNNHSNNGIGNLEQKKKQVLRFVLDLSTIKEWCTNHGLANFKRPRYFYLVDGLPRNSSGKILKQKLVHRFGRIQSKL